VSRGPDQWIKWTTTGCVALLALIAGTVSYLHMHTLVALHGQPGWVAALTPLSVDGMIVAASTTLLADSRSGRRGGVLPWALLVAGSVASLAANVAVAQPTVIGRVIAAWPSFALTASYELLTRQVRGSAAADTRSEEQPEDAQQSVRVAAGAHASARGLTLVQAEARRGRDDRGAAGRGLQRQAWHWALANRASDGALPTGSQIARQHGRHERWGRLVKSAGLAGEFTTSNVSSLLDLPLRN
jgi:Protein of unknown function (DUF2637)